MERRHVSSSHFFIDDKRDGASFKEIRTQRDLLSLVPDDRRALRRMLRVQGLRFRKHPVETVAAVLAYLDRDRP